MALERSRRGHTPGEIYSTGFEDNPQGQDLDIGEEEERDMQGAKKIGSSFTDPQLDPITDLAKIVRDLVRNMYPASGPRSAALRRTKSTELQAVRGIKELPGTNIIIGAAIIEIILLTITDQTDKAGMAKAQHEAKSEGIMHYDVMDMWIVGTLPRS